MAAKGQTFRVNTRNLEAGIRKLLARDANLAKAAMQDVTQFLILHARKRAPKREGHLANSISGQVMAYKKSWAAVVFVPVNSPAAAYAIPMHENDYEPGAASLDKQSKEGVVVGRRYLTRAIEENSKKIVDIIGSKVKK